MAETCLNKLFGKTSILYRKGSIEATLRRNAMRCPICDNEMTAYKEELCYDRKRGITYKRTRYICQTDDVWGRLEIPQKNRDRDLQTSSQHPDTVQAS